MDLYVRDKNLEIIGVVDNAKSIIWNPKYYEDGSYEIYIEATTDNITLFRNGYFITRFDDEYVGLIDKETVIEDIENGNYVTVVGRMADSLISYRIIRYLTYLNGTMESQMEILLNQNIINPSYYPETRKMNCLTMGTHSLATNPTIAVQITYGNLLEFIRSTLKTINSSIKVNFDASNSKLKVIMYTGLDRTRGQSVNENVVFSTEYDNLIKSEYMFDTSKEKNAIYVGGEGEGTSQIVDKYEMALGDGVVSDIDRKEEFIDASDVKTEWTDENGQQHVITDITNDYRPLLQERGKQSIITPEEILQGEIDATMYNYRSDYNLGDIVTIYNTFIGVSVDVRIIEIQEVEDEEGYRVIPIFE